MLVAGVLGAAAGAGALGSPTALPGLPALYVDYSQDCTFSLVVDPGTPLAAGAPAATLPPGTYQLLLSMPNPSSGYTPCTKPRFTLTGAGVATVIEFAGAELRDERLVTLEPSSTYVAEDANAPATTRRLITTAASGSNSVLLPAPTPSTATAGEVQTDIVGSARMRYRGKLVAKVSAAGKATLTRAGLPFRSLKAGWYDVTVVDEAARAGFFVQRAARKAAPLTGVAFIGRRTRRIALGAGTWTFLSGVGRATLFTVDA